ncbi:MAG: hypothetical protein ACR652_23085 [Methylocystis sp.]|uniref:hypothetical protein n=1 Tax=Methylocystis sp. TaxID=1911079 RepID=UPI003DA21D2E
MMEDPLEIVAALRRATQLLQGFAPDVELLVEALERYLATGGATPLEECLGLAAAPGGRSWAAQEAQERRDRALRAMARQTGWGAVRMASEIAKYAGNGWTRDKARATLPDRYAGTYKQHLFEAFRAAPGGDVPSSAKQIRRIVSGGH